MSDVLNRLARGPQGGQSQNYDNWNEMVGAAPPDRFNTATRDVLGSLDPDEYYSHTQPGEGGTDPFGDLQPQQRSGLAESLLGALMGGGMGRSAIGQDAGIQNMDPSRMSPQDLAALAQYTQRNHPEALGQVVQENRDNPNMLESLLGNKAVLALAAGLGAKYLHDQAQKQKAQQASTPSSTSHRRR